MCGIAGIVRFDDQPIGRDRLERMLAAIRHRGPDGEGITEHGRCALVHARLSIIDLLSGQQPMHLPQRDSHGAVHLIFNGEIYNHRYLRKILEKRGHTFQSDHSDTEVLLLGYREWGSELPKHLHGMFAFALWDEQERSLVLVRDRVGKKPLYLAWAEGELVFGSLVSSVAAARPGGCDPRPSPSAMQTYLRLGYPFGESMVDGITEVPPGHWWQIDAAGRVSKQRYWQPPPISRTSTSMGATGAVREVVTEAVAERLESDVPLGCFLSGGIDSSLVAAVAQKALSADGGQLQTFSVAMPDIDYDESPYAQVVAAHIGSKHTILQASASDAMTDLRRLMAVMGEPTADSSLLPTHWLCRATREHVKVALSGDGGDELFGGYDRYRALRLLQTHRWWLQHLPDGWLEQPRPRSTRTRLARLVAAAKAGRDPARQYRRMIHLFTEPQIASLLPDGRYAVAHGAPPLTQWPDEPDPVHAAMRWDLSHYLPHELLRKVDRASMAVALEVRCPLLATQVADLAGHLPARVLTPRGRQKALLREVASSVLPASIIDRPKRGFAVPIGGWFRHQLRDPLADHLFDGTLETFGIARPAVQRMFDDHIAGTADHTHRLFALLQLVLWGHWLRAPWLP